MIESLQEQLRVHTCCHKSAPALYAGLLVCKNVSRQIPDDIARIVCPQSGGGCLNLYTIGHSTRTIDVFLDLLESHGIKQVVDVRTAVGSRKNPQFMKEALQAALGERCTDYVHMPSLGGFRRPLTDSSNAGWRNPSFRGYADYMQTAEFDSALEKLKEIASLSRTTVMCAEAVPWRCHRSLIADACVARGLTVGHITSQSQCRPHILTAFARIADGHVTYPGESVAGSGSATI
jgi:Protein of unknown function, DUF488